MATHITQYRFCIQCRELETDITGSFMYDSKNPFHAVSPVFADCVDLFSWMEQHNFTTGVLADFPVYEIERKGLKP